eukprot:CAMPEP_0181180632 /NCGR_PEP_ID=MMETSP1096-20121128/6905_1 /TAXON_ID=156174 ORGANISM="Chrysochromulina ericina, Strain CCMP281" /NCGR_SAMPLE_ID=MMETSP1096 /ASSEMBLY_ACC=CAM_ASM_000453 /LENGTH=248 /DNA_ID=CAMNT_0023269077 /DNA_START=45 /DNA_END=794 /DNA_ORIENTATION=+
MNVTFEPEAVSGCCGSRQLACYGAPSFLSGPDWLQSPRLFDGYDLSAYFLTCQDHLKARVMKADDMLPNAERLSAFVHLHSLAIRLVYISRHPFGNVASLRKWILQAHGELLPTFHNVSSLALLWRAATRRFLDARPGTFAAAVRYEDVMTSAMDTIQRAYSQVLGRPIKRRDLDTRAVFEDVLNQGWPADTSLQDANASGASTSTEALEDAEAVTVHQLCSTEMDSMGYAADGTALAGWTWTPALAG